MRFAAIGVLIGFITSGWLLDGGLVPSDGLRERSRLNPPVTVMLVDGGSLEAPDNQGSANQGDDRPTR